MTNITQLIDWQLCESVHLIIDRWLFITNSSCEMSHWT